MSSGAQLKAIRVSYNQRSLVGGIPIVRVISGSAIIDLQASGQAASGLVTGSSISDSQIEVNAVVEPVPRNQKLATPI